MRSIYISILSIIIAFSLCFMASAATVDGVYTYHEFTVADPSDYNSFSVTPYKATSTTGYAVNLSSRLVTSDDNVYLHYYPSSEDQVLPGGYAGYTVGSHVYENKVTTSAWLGSYKDSIAMARIVFVCDDFSPSGDYVSATFRVSTVLPKDYDINSNDFNLTIHDESSNREYIELTPDIINVTYNSIPFFSTEIVYYSFDLKYYFTVLSNTNAPEIVSATLTYPLRYYSSYSEDSVNSVLTSFDNLVLSTISEEDYIAIQKAQDSLEPIINIYTQQTPEDLEQIVQGEQQADKLDKEMDKLEEANKKLEEALGDNYVEDPTELVQKPDIFDNENFNDNIAALTNSIWDDAIITPMFGIVSGLSILSYVLFGKKDK